MPRKDPQRCSTIRDRVDKWEKYWTINRSLYYEWIDFVMGDQWREDESKLFERYNKIPLVFNKLGVLMNHLLGDQIQNSPNLVILPDEDVPVETAQIRGALIKNITLNSDTSSVFNDAFGQAIVGGYSAFRVGTRYLHDESFEQEIYYEGFNDPNRCYWGIEAKHKCKVDSMTSGFRVRVSRRWFRDQHGEDTEKQIGSSAITEDSTLAFADDDSITMVYDYEREPSKGRIYQLSNNMVVNDEQYKQLRKEKVNGKKYLFYNGEPLTVFNDREVIRYKTEHTLIAGDFVLDETEFPASLSPVIYVDQKSYFTKSGQEITRSFFKDVKDAQKYLNYLATQSAYLTKISRYDQFIMPRKCAASPDSQQQWRDPSVVNGALYYDETPSGAKPEQLKPPELSQSLMMQYERTLIDIQSGTGMYDAQLGDVDDRVSGIGMKRRNERGTKNTQMPRDAINRAIWTSGEIVNEMIPTVYDTQRKLKLAMPDSESQTVEINKPADEYGLHTENNMKEGRYKIRIKPGPSYEGQKEVALESLQAVLTADKSGAVFPMIADLYAENLPLDNSLELRNRLRTLVPPEIIEAGKTGKPVPKKDPQPDPMVMLKQQELQQAAQAMQMKMQHDMKALEIKQQELQRKALETQQDINMEYSKIEAEKQEKAAELQSAIMKYQAEMQNISKDLQINHSQNLIKMLTHAGQIHHEKELQDLQHKHEKVIKPKPTTPTKA
jgi:Phage P22-like portal protein